MMEKIDLESAILEFARFARRNFISHGWKWSFDDEMRYPTLDEMNHAVRELYSRVVRNRPIGGMNEFIARRHHIAVSINTYGDVSFMVEHSRR